jgi:predicted dehydrogenase
LKRRDFVQVALATVSTAGIGAVGCATEKKSTPTAPCRLRIGFLGAGHSHATGKIKAVQESADWELVGVCEEDPRLQAEFAKKGIPLLSERELLERSQVVAVESQVQDHARYTRLALAAGKHVHLEKPPADTLAAFQELQVLARRKHVLLQMGYMWRYHPAMNAAIEAARRGWLGEVYLVRGTINTQLAAQQRCEVARFPGGTLFELGSHLIDPLARLLGRATKITPVLKTNGPFQDHLADNTLAIFEFPKSLGIILSNTLQPRAGQYRSFEILGTQGTAIVNPIEPPGLMIDLAKSAGPYKAGLNTVPMPKYFRYVPEFADLAVKIREGKPLAVSPEEDLLVQETLLRACAAEPSEARS